MTKRPLFLWVVLVVAALAGGCRKHGAPVPWHQPVPVGAVSPGQFHTIPFGYNPSVSGWPGAVGDIVQNAGSTSAWVRSGTADTAWVAFPQTSIDGGSGGGIAQDGGVLTPLAGVGTVANPLAIPVVIPPARVVAISNITLSGTQTIDGRAVNVGDHVLAQAQSSAPTNGPYIVASGAWSRDPSFATAAQMVPGATITIYDGTTGIGSLWEFQTQGAIIVGTTALAFAQISPPDFGSNTTVSLADSAATLVPALHLTTALTVNTHGATTSTLTHQLMSGGTQTTTMVESPAGITVPPGSTTVAAINFASSTNSGIYQQGVNDYRLEALGQGSLSWNSTGLTDVMNGSCFQWNNSTGICQGAANNANLIVSGGTANQGDIQVGPSGALATNAAGGWIDVPTMAGAYTGTPGQISTGKAALFVDTTNDKVCFVFAGSSTAHCATLIP